MIDKVKYTDQIPTLPTQLTTHEVKRVWKITKENKASIFSGRYNAVYKPMAFNHELLQILTSSMNLPLLTGTPYRRWGT